MLQNKKINRAQYETASEAPLGVSKTRVDPREAPYFMEMVRLYLEERYGSNQIFEGGLRIYTTLDADLQQAAEESLERRLTDLEQRNGTKKTRASVLAKSKTAQPGEKSQTDYLQGAVVCIDPASGQIRALVGGRDFNESNFNRATQAARQPGSAFKPFIYTAAIDNGYTPNEMILDTPVSFRAGNGEDWSPQNYDHKFRGPVTLRTALAKSLNVPAAKLLQKLGTPVVTSYARRLGIHSHLGNDLSLALGTSEVNLLELTSAYGVFADQGVRTTPVFVLRVEDKNGKILEQTRTAAEEVLSPETALPIWVDVVSAGTKGKPPQDFPVPNGVVSRLICSQTGLLANPSCPETETELFREGSEPTGFCDIHTGAVPPPEVEPHDLEQHDSEAVPEEHLRL